MGTKWGHNWVRRDCNFNLKGMEMADMAVIWRINEANPILHFAVLLRVRAKEQKANARLSANKKMKEENQIKTSLSRQ